MPTALHRRYRAAKRSNPQESPNRAKPSQSISSHKESGPLILEQKKNAIVYYNRVQMREKMPGDFGIRKRVFTDRSVLEL